MMSDIGVNEFKLFMAVLRYCVNVTFDESTSVSITS